MASTCTGVVSVDPRFFDVVRAPVLRGRALTTADAETTDACRLVNQTFVNDIRAAVIPLAAGFASDQIANPPPSRGMTSSV